MPTDAEEVIERPDFFEELASILHAKNLECQESSLDGIDEPSPKRRRWCSSFSDKEEAEPRVAKRPACHFEEDCNRTEDSYWLLQFFQGGPSEKNT